MKEIQLRMLKELTSISNFAFVVGIIPIVLFVWKIIPASEIVLIAYWLVAISSLLVVGLTGLRWLKKIPTPVTWFQLTYSVIAICTWISASVTLIRFYSDEGTITNVVAAILVAPVAPLTLLAVYLGHKAYVNQFKA